MNKLIFDFGTNSIKAFLYNDENKLIYKKKNECRLGDAGKNADMLDENVIKAIDAVNEVINEAKAFGELSTTAFGTEVFRAVSNSAEAIDRIKNQTGVAIKVLSQQDELEYYWKGVVKDFTHNGDIAVIDIGGGSVQFMYGNREGLKGHHKLKTGALYLRKSFIDNDPPTAENYKKIEEYILEQIKDINVKFSADTPFIHGSSSVIDFYEEAKIDMDSYGHSKAHPYKTDLNTTKKLYDTMKLLPKSERSKFFPSHPDFTDGSSIGLANVLLIAEKTGLKFELPSNNNLIDGFL